MIYFTFVFQVIFGHNYGPLDQKPSDLEKVRPLVLLTLQFNIICLGVQSIEPLSAQIQLAFNSLWSGLLHRIVNYTRKLSPGDGIGLDISLTAHSLLTIYQFTDPQ